MAKKAKSAALRKENVEPTSTPVEGAPAQDQSAPAKTPRGNAQVQEWRAANKAKLHSTGTIRIPAKYDLKSGGENPKRNKNGKTGGAADRFALYRDGQSVADYVALSMERYKVQKAFAQSDVRWDVVHGFISVE